MPERLPEPGSLIDAMAKALAEDEANHEFALSELGQEIGRFPTVYEAKGHAQIIAGKNLLFWERVQDRSGRWLWSGPFSIRSVPKILESQ